MSFPSGISLHSHPDDWYINMLFNLFVRLAGQPFITTFSQYSHPTAAI